MICDEVREAVRAGGLFARDRPVLAMLSGGRDSTCLLDVAVALLGAAAVSALHVNYGLREQSDADERHCAGLCEQLGVELEVVRIERSSTQRPLSAATADASATDAPAPADQRATAPAPADPRTQAPQSGNLQAWARELRYAQATRIAGERDALIATGHTASDQVETILYRLAASPGRRALLGMVASEGRLIRPLLVLSREQTAAYCGARDLRWCEDESNDDERYARARVRSRLVPALRAVHPAAEANVLRTAALLREETELLDGLVAEELGGRASIALARLGELPAALARLVVVRLAEDATGSYVPQAGDRVHEILALGRRGGRAELHVGAQAGAVIDHGLLRMVRLEPRG
ncbi:MAG: tRNA lysidine(34) synthetase [Solirubrobacteraceae bacterium]